MNAIEFLTKQHVKIRKYFSEIKDASHHSETQKKLFSELSSFLVRHETMEQKVWYPKLKELQIDKVNKIIDHLIVEEKEADKSIHAIKKLNSYEAWKENVSKLNKDVDHHATEEEDKLFPEVTKKMEEKELQQIGKEMFHFFNNV